MEFLLWGVAVFVAVAVACVLALISLVVFVFSALGGEEEQYKDWLD